MSMEHRNEVRQRVFLKGRIRFNNGSSTMDCLVRDFSPAGARIALSQTATLPEVFDLHIPQKDRTYRATLRWRREDGVGVTFAEESVRGTAPPTPPAAAPRAWGSRWVVRSGPASWRSASPTSSSPWRSGAPP